MNPRIIVIDGKTYQSVEEMPADVREKYERALRALKDDDGNRIPDAFESMKVLEDRDQDGMPDALEGLASTPTTIHQMKIVVDGKEYNSLESLPADVRARYEAALGQLDANRNGIPDFVEGMLTSTEQTPAVAASFEVGSDPAPARPRRQALPSSPTITPDTSSGWMLVLSGLFVLLLCAGGLGALWYFFLR